jgi:ADP-L-glycero-D-manno-heptose 6-epimerase
MNYIVVTGAAGFIGSRVVSALNAAGLTNIIAVDNLSRADKFHNLVDAEIADYFDKTEFLSRLRGGDFDSSIDAVLHQGACSDTMNLDGRYMMENNYRYSLSLLDFCQDEDIPLIYASSAAVYGASKSFREDRALERPLNVYGYSKFLFDQVVRRRLADGAARVVGLRYFNVYGAGESHKGAMASIAYQLFCQLRGDGRMRLFGGSSGYAAGEQQRDFVAVEDVAKVNLYFLRNPERSGIFNLGSGRAQSFNDVACAVATGAGVGGSFSKADELVQKRLLEYVPFPRGLEARYQSFTQADLTALREAGYDAEFLAVAEGVSKYCAALQAAG